MVTAKFLIQLENLENVFSYDGKQYILDGDQVGLITDMEVNDYGVNVTVDYTDAEDLLSDLSILKDKTEEIIEMLIDKCNLKK